MYIIVMIAFFAEIATWQFARNKQSWMVNSNAIAKLKASGYIDNSNVPFP